MSTQDTTLPPGHFEPMTAMQVAGFKAKAYALANAYACASTREHTDAARLELLEEIGRLTTAIAAQAQLSSPLVAVGEDGEGQENHCPECGAEPGQMCSDEEGTEHGRKVHAVRQAQQAQGVPAAALKRIKQNLMHQRRFGVEDQGSWRRAATQAEGDIEELLAAAPQAEPQTPAPAHHAELDYDALECDRCHGKGWHWVESEGVDWRDKVSTKEHCEQCNGVGWCGPDASKLAEAELDKVLGEYRDASEEFDAEVLARFIKSHPKHAAALRRYSTVQLTFLQPTREEIEAEEIPVAAPQAAPAPAPQALTPLTDEQIEALPVWAPFVGLWPQSRKEIARAIERAHGIGASAGGEG